MLKLNCKVFLFFRVKREQRPVSPDSGLESEKPTGELTPFISFVITINVVQGIYNENINMQISTSVRNVPFLEFRWLLACSLFYSVDSVLMHI